MTITPVAFVNSSVTNGGTITVPANVNSSHLGVAVFASNNIYSTGSVPSIDGWISRVNNPSAANFMEWNVLSRLGGMTAGDTITVNVNNSTTFAVYMIWYDTAGLDITNVGAPSGRGTTNSQYVAINGVNATGVGQGVLVISSDKSSATGTNVNSWSGNYTPATDAYAEDLSGTNTSAFFGHFTTTSIGSTGTETANYNQSSGNGVGVQMTLGTPTTGSFLDPFTKSDWNAQGANVNGGIWMTNMDTKTVTMSGGVLSMPFTLGYPYMYPQVSLSFANSTMAIEVNMDDSTIGSFSMRLTSDAAPEQGNSFVSCGIQAGGRLYMNHRTSDGTDHIQTFSTVVASGSPIGMRLRNSGTSTVYFDTSTDMVNWTNIGSVVVTAFNPTTDLVRPLFQTGASTDNWSTYARLMNMNLAKWTPAAPQPFRATSLWSIWNGSKEIEVAPGVGWAYYSTATDPGPITAVYVSMNTFAGLNIYPTPDASPYPTEGTYPGAATYPGGN